MWWSYTIPPSEHTGIYIPVSSKYLFLSSTTSIKALACPRPIPFVSRVIQIDPPPTPTFIKSAPAFAKYLNPSLSTTFPAPIFRSSPYFSLTKSIVFFCHTEYPSEESIQIISTPASTSAGILSS